MSDLSNSFVIGDENWQDHSAAVVDGHGFGRGLVQRDYDQFPHGCYNSAPPFSLDDMPVIPMEEWPERIAEMERTKSRLSDIRNVANNGQSMPSLDQNGQGYCWAYSTTSCVQLLRARANLPYVPLSGHSVACLIKNFRDQGGWGAASLDFVSERGIMPQSIWPAKSMSRQHNTPENWDVAQEYRVSEAWVELSPPVYARDMSVMQVGTCLLNRIPVIGDYNWWRHSVALMDLVDVYPSRSARDPRRYGCRIINSWTDRWGERGTSVLKDSRAFPDGGAAPRVPWGG